ncbi:Stage II sporulation protein P (SpoIIP) [Clostridium liquoris]|uniref:Stage II sporulation protein P (SpoIIP) n=1 Tax=Clostridium liquoris TaxID=1289519 RepID=A0A2T0B0X8_9CLOT|nr:Stage II sporulation protein P (SpoIIP) [Clostridium liquoris]
MDFKGQEKNKINYLKKKSTQDSKSNILIFILTLCLTLFIILPFMVKANPQGEGTRENMFYVQVLNSEMSLIKATVFNEEDIAESNFSIKGSIFKLFNVDISNPIALIGKEISCISIGNQVNKAGDKSTDILFNPFKLNDKSITIDNNSGTTDLPNTTVSLYDPKLKKELNKSKPEVFIYHTHTTESYKPENNNSLDETKNVCAIGDALANELENNYGIAVIHDKTVHDAQASTQSYERSSATVDKYLKKYGDFKLIIDLHRDGVDNKNIVTTKMNGEDVAKIMFVMSRKNPHYKNNLAVVNKLLEISDKLYPNLSRGIYYYNYGTRYFNQNKSNNSILIEVGANSNNFQDAKNASKYLARIIGEYINGKK